MDRNEAEGFDSPEEAVLSGWGPVSRARAVEVRVERSDSVYVVVDAEPSHPLRVHCERINGRWLWTQRRDRLELRLEADTGRRS